MPKKWLFRDEAGVATIVADDLAELRESGMRPTQGDTRCITFGHLTRMAVWNLRKDWRPEDTTPDKFQRFAIAIHALGDPERILKAVEIREQPPVVVQFPSPLRPQERPGFVAMDHDNARQRSSHAVSV